MTDRTKSKIPFINLHSHTVAGSVFDALGYAAEHFDFCYSNGAEAMAITEHGNMNSLPHMLLHSRKMKAEGKEFKPIYGCEAYFIPSVEEWREEYERAKEDAKAARTLAKSGTSGATVEDEGTSKKEMKSILNRRRHLVLLVQNQTGLNNLFRLISESYREENFYRYPRMDYSLLEKYNEGIIASSACLGGPLAGDFWANSEYEEDEETGRDKWVKSNPEAVLEAMRETTRRFKGIFGDRWYGELQWNNIPEQHELNQYIIQVCEEFDVKLISTADSHYPNPEAWKDRELYKRLGWMGKAPSWGTTELPVNVEEVGYELYPKNGDQMWEAYKRYSASCGKDYNDELVLDSITRTHEIAFERIEAFEPNTDVKLPDFVVPAGQTATQALVQHSMEGLRARDLGENKEYVDRLKHELGVIDDRGFSKYFLTMKSIVDQALETMLVGPGRGSACGSLVAYTLNITQIDPIKYDLPFERFLRSDATDYPDIDTDVSAPMVLKEKLIEEWGANSVVPISNWNTLQLKSLIKDISKFYEVPYGEVNKVTTAMMDEATPAAKIKHGIKAGVYAPTWEEVMELSPSLRGYLVKYPIIKTHVEALVGQVKSCSRHAGGVLIADNLNEHMPIISSGGVRQSPWAEGQNVRHLEPLGFIKFDLLGLSTLKMFEGCIEHILRRHHGIKKCTFDQIREYYDSVLHPDILNLNDSAVYEHVFHKGNFAGTFQFTGDGAADFCKNVRPNNIAEISAVTSIFRPGPLCLSGDTEVLRSFAYYNDNSVDNVCGQKRATTRHKLKDLYDLFHKPGNRNRLYLSSYDEENRKIVRNKVVNVVESGKKEVYSVRYQRRSSGQKKVVSTSILDNSSKDKQNNMEATLAHRFLTKEGWKRLEDLVEGDYILVINQGCKKGPASSDGCSRRDCQTTWGRKNFRNIAFYHYDYKCVMCDWNEGSLDVNHIEGNRNTSNKAENLCYLCPNHHRQYSEGTLIKESVLSARKKYEHPFFTRDLMFVRYLGKKFEREVETYDIEMENPHHNFFAGGCVVHNSARVNDAYVAAKEGHTDIEWYHPIFKEITEETYGHIIYQEQISELTHRIGKNISRDDGNTIRKLLTKSGTGKTHLLAALHQRFLDGAVEKGIRYSVAEEIWELMAGFAKYGFSKNHATAYSIISYQCAWLWTKYPSEWAAAFLDKEPEKRKEKAINIAKSLGYTIRKADVNYSSFVWEIDPDDPMLLIQPLSSLKGLGDAAIQQVVNNRPYNSVEEFIFHDDIIYSKLNKKALDVLVRSGAMDSLIDERFEGRKHFWSAVAVDRVYSRKKFDENIIKYKDEGEFSKEEEIDNLTTLTGMFPIHLVMTGDVKQRLDEHFVPPISSYDPDLGLVWFIPREIIKRKTKNGKPYWIVITIDSNSVLTKFRCWGIIEGKDRIHLNRPYMGHLDHDPTWGFSTRSIRRNLRLLG